jgi:hypothetical protein
MGELLKNIELALREVVEFEKSGFVSLVLGNTG